MKISENLIKDKKIVGVSSSGKPILMVETHGGLFAFFTKNEWGHVDTLATAAHKAIGVWLSEKKDPGLQWNQTFDKSEGGNSENDNRYKSLYKSLFSPGSQSLSKSQLSDYFIVFDPETKNISLMTKNEVKYEIAIGELKKHYLIRDAALTAPVSRAEFHQLFKSIRNK